MNENENEITAVITSSDDTPAGAEQESGLRAAAPAASAAGEAPAHAAGDESSPEDASASEEAAAPEPAGADATASQDGGAEDTAPALTDSDIRRIVSDPMFVCFAKGKNGELSALCRDFCEMLRLGDESRPRTNLDPSVMMRVTPHSEGSVTTGVTLTERQRVLARQAGMSYREYYDLICGIPEKK